MMLRMHKVKDSVFKIIPQSSKPGGHDVVEVNKLDEGLDLAAQSDLLLRHGLGDLLGCSCQTGNEGVAVGARLLAEAQGYNKDKSKQHLDLLVPEKKYEHDDSRNSSWQRFTS